MKQDKAFNLRRKAGLSRVSLQGHEKAKSRSPARFCFLFMPDKKKD
jgi:hypothetical protein